MRASRHFQFPSTPRSLRLGYACGVALGSARFASLRPGFRATTEHRAFASFRAEVAGAKNPGSGSPLF
jgi:hypothetical protein